VGAPLEAAEQDSLYNLLNVAVQTANKMGFQAKKGVQAGDLPCP
jgi:hypothetical protein